MSSPNAASRLSLLVQQLQPACAEIPSAGENQNANDHKLGTSSWFNFHTLSPTSFLLRAAEIEPDAPAIYHRTADNAILRRSYAEFADRAKGFAYYLLKKGHKRVGILCNNTPAFLDTVFGVGAAGGVNVAINYRLKADDICYIFEHSDADSIVVDAEYVHLLDEYCRKHPRVPIIIDTDTIRGDGPFDKAVSEGHVYDAEMGGNGWATLQSQASDELAVNALAYTSGTTSRPKGVEFTHRGCYLAALANVVEAGLGYHDGDRTKYLWTLPMFHAQGWTFPWAVTAVRGTHYCLRGIKYPEIWQLLRQEGITHYCAAPTVNTLLCNDSNAAKLSDKVRVSVAGSAPSAHLLEHMMSLNLHPVHVYGLTETYGPISKGYLLPEWEELPDRKDKFAKMARQGHGFITSRPCRVIKLEAGRKGLITNVDRDGKEIGEIVFEGNICARGYYKDDSATRDLFLGGVCHSGDLAVWHPDGAIQILDRAKDVIIAGGENISSVAVESILVTHPMILECGVIAVQDKQWGERPKAYITTKQGSRPKTAEIIEWCRNHKKLSRFMVPRDIEIVDELPKTSTGKILKKELRARSQRDNE